MKNFKNENNPIKIILLGESGVGKTCLLNVFFGQRNEEQIPTQCSLSFDGEFEYYNNFYKYCIWDTAGQEAYRAINKIYFRDAKIILIVYAIDNKNSFTNIDFWINYAKEYISSDGYIMEIIANKNDLYESRMVMEEEGIEAAKKYGIDLFTTSAISDPDGFKNHVNNLIEKYIKMYLEKNNIEENKSVKINKRKKKKKKFC